MVTILDYAINKISMAHDGTGGGNSVFDPVATYGVTTSHIVKWDYGGGVSDIAMSPANRAESTVTGNLIEISYVSWGEASIDISDEGLSGDISVALQGVYSYRDSGSNTTSGDLAVALGSAGSNIVAYLNYGSNTTSGDLAVALGSANSKVETYSNRGSNTTSGDLAVALGSANSKVETYSNRGSNTTSGDLAVALGSANSNVKTYINQGLNTTSGDLAVALGSAGSNVERYDNQGSNTTSGDLAVALGSANSNVTYYYNAGSNTTSGDLAVALGSANSNVTYYYNTGDNSCSYTSSSWANNDLNYVYHKPNSGGLSSSEVDNFLIDLSSTTKSNGTFDMPIPNGARTAASDSAVTALTGNGWTITTA